MSRRPYGHFSGRFLPLTIIAQAGWEVKGYGEAGERLWKNVVIMTKSYEKSRKKHLLFKNGRAKMEV